VAVTYITSATALNAGLECNRPTGYDATFPSAGTWGPNDGVVFIGWWYDSTTATMTPPSGFNQPGGGARRVANHTNVLIVEVVWKLAGGSEPTTYNAGGTAESQYNNSAVIIIRGLDTSTSTAAFDKATGNSGQSGTVTWTVGAGGTPARNGSLAIAIHGGYNNPANAIGGTPTATERINALDGVNDVSTIPVDTTDTTDRTATKTSDTWCAVYAIFQPAAGAAATSDLGEGGYARNVRRNPVYRMSPSGLYVPERAYGFLHAP